MQSTEGHSMYQTAALVIADDCPADIAIMCMVPVAALWQHMLD